MGVITYVCPKHSSTLLLKGVPGLERNWELLKLWHAHASYNTMPLQQSQLVFELLVYPTAHLCMMTSSNGSLFRLTGPLGGEFTGHR